MTAPGKPVAWNPQPRRPAWGVRTPRRKSLATGQPILVAPAPDRVTLSLAAGAGHAGPPARPVVAIGQRVLRGEPIATPGQAGGPVVHASISGVVSAIGLQPVAGRPEPLPCIVIDSDGRDEVWSGYEPLQDPEQRPAGELLAGLAAAGLVGLGGALYPTAWKVATSRPAVPGAGIAPPPVLLLNGAECEPYISCDDLLIRERADRLVRGGQILLAALGAPLCIIAVKTDMPEARVALYNALLAAGDPRVVMSVVTARYPAGGERQLIELVLGREVPVGGLPADVGVVCQNVATAVAAADFFLEGRPLISRVVTVSGGGVAAPRNIEARLGTAAADLISLAGGYQNDPVRLVMGGPMMGLALPTDALPITAGTNCLLAATAGELGQAVVGTLTETVDEMPCIRCGACLEVCPAGLAPQDLLVASRRGTVGQLESLGVSECIECGACDYVCPSHLPLTREFLAGKALVADARWSREQARLARERFEAREARLTRESRAREAQLDGLLGNEAGGDRQRSD